jgi:hypothetical protein
VQTGIKEMQTYVYLLVFIKCTSSLPMSLTASQAITLHDPLPTLWQKYIVDDPWLTIFCLHHELEGTPYSDMDEFLMEKFKGKHDELMAYHDAPVGLANCWYKNTPGHVVGALSPPDGTPRGKCTNFATCSASALKQKLTQMRTDKCPNCGNDCDDPKIHRSLISRRGQNKKRARFSTKSEGLYQDWNPMACYLHGGTFTAN